MFMIQFLDPIEGQLLGGRPAHPRASIYTDTYTLLI